MAKASTRIFPQLIYKSSREGQKGFSMIEIMIVLALIGMFVVFGARRLVDNNQKMKSSVRRFAVTVKKLRNKARVQNTTYRLVFDLPQKQEEEQSYWVESTSEKALLITEEQREERIKELEDQVEGDEKVIDPQGFAPVGEQANTLPRGLFFDSIQIAGEEKEQKEGRIFIYFFPQGFVQESAIHLTDRNKLNWTLTIHPLTGKVDIMNKYVDLEELAIDE